MAERTNRRPSRRPARSGRGGSRSISDIVGGSSGTQQSGSERVDRSQQSLDNVFARISASNAPQAAQAASIASKAGSGIGGFLGGVLDVIDTPRAAVVSFSKEFSDLLDGDGFSPSDFVQQTRDNYGFGQALADKTGGRGTGNIWADRILGFTGDVALDPLTYATFGAAKVASVAGDGAALTARQVADRFLAEGVEKLGEKGAKEAAARVTQRGVMAATAEELAAIGAQKGLFYTVPGTGRVGRAFRRAAGEANPTEQLVRIGGDTVGNAVSKAADVGYRYVRQPLRNTSFHQAVTKAFNGELGALKNVIKTSDEATRVLVADQILRDNRVTRSVASALRRDMQNELGALQRAAKSARLDPSILTAALRDGMSGKTWDSLNGAQRAVVEQAAAMNARWRTVLNDQIGYEWLRDSENYVFRLRTEDARTALKKGNTGKSAPLGLAVQEQARLKAGDEFLGVELVASKVHPRQLSIEAQIEEIARDTFKDKYVQLFETDFFKSMNAYLEGTTRRAQQKMLEQRMVDQGIARLTGVIEDVAVLPDGSINPNHPIHQALDKLYAAADEAGGTAWLASVDEGHVQAMWAHNEAMVEGLAENYNELFGEFDKKRNALLDKIGVRQEQVDFYRAEVQSLMEPPSARGADAVMDPANRRVFQQTTARLDDAQRELDDLLTQLGRLETSVDMEYREKLRSIIRQRRGAQKLSERPSREMTERAARQISQADQAERSLFRPEGRGARPSFAESQAANEADLQRLGLELDLTTERNVAQSTQRPAPPATVLPQVDPTDMPRATGQRFRNTQAFGDGADEINAGLAGVRADNPTVAAVADQALVDVRASVDQIVKDAAAAVRATGSQQAKDLSATAKRLRAQLKKLNVDDLLPSQMRVASEAMAEASTRLRAEFDDLMGRLRAVRAEIKDLEARKRSNLAGKPSKKQTQRLAAARSTRDALKKQVDELSSLRKELDATSKTLADRAARTSELAAVGGVRGRASATAADIAASGKGARAEVRSGRSTVRAADKAEQASLAADSRRVSRNLRQAQARQRQIVGRLDKQQARLERQLSREQAKVLTPAQKRRVQEEMRYRSTASKLFEIAEQMTRGGPTQMGYNPGLRDTIRLQAQANVAAADLIARGVQPRRIEDLAEAVYDHQEQVLGFFNDALRKFGPTTQAEDWVVEAMQAGMKMGSAKDVNLAMRYIDKITTLFKTQALMTPGYHIRNFFGGMWNNYLGDVEIGAYSRFERAWRKFDAELKRFDGDSRLAVANIRTMTGEDAEQLRWIADIWDGGIIGTTSRYMDETNPSVFGPISKPFNMAQEWGMNSVERRLRGAMAFDVLAKGGTIDDAIEKVIKHHFDYTSLSDVERSVRRVIPFYGFMRHNFPLQVEALLKQPQKVNRYLAVKRNVELGTDEEGIVPAYFGENLAVRLPWSIGGQQMYILPDLPLKDIRRIQDTADLFRGDVSGFASTVNPLFKAPIEMTLNRQFFNNIPFREGYVQAPRYITTIPGLANALEKVGVIERTTDGAWVGRDEHFYALEQFSPLLGRIRRLTPNEEKYQERAATAWVNTLFGAGLRLNTETEQANELARRRRTLEQLEKDAASLGYEMPTYGIQIQVPNKEFVPQ